MTLAAPSPIAPLDQLADPLAAFYAQDPTILRPPEPGPPAAVARHPHDRVAWEIAAAVLVAGTVVRHHLAQQQPAVGQSGAQARGAWAMFAPSWLRLTVPAIRQAYLLGRVDGLTDDELTALSTDYARTLGDYLDTSSAEALEAGMNQQLAQRWDAGLAWHRAAAAYGIDKRDMRAYLVAATRDKSVDPIPATARALVDKAFLARAERIGNDEAYSATQAGQALSWMWLEGQGRLPAGSKREWDLGRTQAHCPVCEELSGQLVPLHQPFVLKSGAKLWAPRAHPGCLCIVRLRPPAQRLAKAYDPRERRDRHGRWAEVAEQQEEEKPSELPAPRSPLRAPGSPLRAPPLQASPLRASPFLPPSPLARSPLRARSPLAGSSPFLDPVLRAPRPRSLQRRVTVIGLPTSRPPDRAQPFYLPVDNFHELTDTRPIGARYDISGMVDFTWAASRPVASAETSPWDMLNDDHVFFKAVPFEMPRDVLEEHWEQLTRAAWTGWNVAMTEVDNPDNPLIEKLSGADLANIYRLAGWEDEQNESRMRDKIVESVQGFERGNEARDSLAAAYADYVVYAQPHKVLGNQLGGAIDGALDSAEDAHLVVRDFREGLTVPSEQVFAFEEGFHPGTKLVGEEAYMQGAYAPYLHRYRSALHDFAGKPPPMRFGLRETFMLPIVSQNGVWMPPQHS